MQNSAAASLTTTPRSFQVGDWFVFTDFSYIEHQDGRREELEWMALEVLRYLASRQGQLVSVDELMDKVWTGKIVTEGTVRRIISLLRKAFGDDAKTPAYIQSIPKRGYVLIAPVQSTQDMPAGLLSFPQKGHAPATTIATATPVISPKNRFRPSSRFVLVLSTLLFALVLAGILWQQQSESLAVEPLLTLKGQERDPFLDLPQQHLLFSHKRLQRERWHLFVQNLQNQQIRQLTSGDSDNVMPLLSPDRSKLAYLQSANQKIRLMLAGYQPEQGLANSEIAFESPYSISHISWNRSGSGLFMAATMEQGGTSAIWFMPLNTRQPKQITLPPASTMGDVQLALSQDEQYLAVIRVNGKASMLANNTSTLLVYQLDGLIPVMSKPLTGRARSVAFRGHKLLYLLENQIYELDPQKPDLVQLLPTSQMPVSQLISQDGNLLLNSGDLYNAEIRQQANPFEPAQQNAAGLVISSQASDYFAEYSRQDDKVYFLSTRSGSRQIWAWQANKGFQMLTDFKDSAQLSSLTVAYQQPLLAGIAGQSLFILDTHSYDLRTLQTEPGTLTQVFWKADDSGLYYVLATATEKNLWFYDLTSRRSTLQHRQVEAALPYDNQLLLWNGEQYLLSHGTDSSTQALPFKLPPLQKDGHWQIAGHYLYQTEAEGQAFRLRRTNLLNGSTEVSEKYILGPYRSHFSISPDQHSLLLTYYTEPETNIYQVKSPLLSH